MVSAKRRYSSSVAPSRATQTASVRPCRKKNPSRSAISLAQRSFSRPQAVTASCASIRPNRAFLYPRNPKQTTRIHLSAVCRFRKTLRSPGVQAGPGEVGEPPLVGRDELRPRLEAFRLPLLVGDEDPPRERRRDLHRRDGGPRRRAGQALQGDAGKAAEFDQAREAGLPEEEGVAGVHVPPAGKGVRRGAEDHPAVREIRPLAGAPDAAFFRALPLPRAAWPGTGRLARGAGGASEGKRRAEPGG